MQKILLGLLTALLFGTTNDLLGQSPYFFRTYPNHLGKTISQSYFHPDGGLTTLFSRTSGANENIIHRMDSSGTILHSYSTLGQQFWPIEVEVADNGYHWALHKRPSGVLPGDSVFISYLDPSLNLVWKSGFTIPLGAGEELRGGSIVKDGNELLLVGYVSTYSIPYWAGLWLARVDAAGNMIWSERYPTNVSPSLIPQRVGRLSNGNIAINGYQLEANGPPHVGILLQVDSSRNIVSEHWAGIQSHDFGNIIEQPNGDILFLAGFDYIDWIYQFTHTNLHVLPAGGNQFTSTKFIEEWKGEDCFIVGNTIYGLVDGHDGLKLFGGGMSIPIAFPGNPADRYHNSSFGFKDQLYRKQSMDHILTSQGADVLIGLGYEGSSVLPILTRTNLNGAGIVAVDEELVSEKLFEIGPNPSSGLVKVSFETHAEASLKVYDNSGKFCLSRTAQSGEVLDLGDCAPGVYFVEVYATGDGTFLGTRKLVIAR